jgi:hypothetical protein
MYAVKLILHTFTYRTEHAITLQFNFILFILYELLLSFSSDYTLLGIDFGVLGHLWSQNDVFTSWLRLTAASNCFPHPY